MNPQVKKILIITGTVVGSILFYWLLNEYVHPAVKAKFAITEKTITIQNLNRTAWDNPWITLDDGAVLKLNGEWRPMETRTFQVSDFIRETDQKPHNPHEKPGFTAMISSADNQTTIFYDFDSK